MIPPHQGFKPEHLSVDLGLRLIVHGKFAVRERRARVALQLVAFAQAPVHLGREDYHVAAIGFGAEQAASALAISELMSVASWG